MDTLSDENLIKHIAKGDRLALEALYGRHRVKLYRFLLRLANNETVAEDILSDVFFAATAAFRRPANIVLFPAKS